MTTLIPLSDLVEDLSIYPRSAVSSVQVANLAAAIEAGCALPPIVADRASLRIVDGFHRRHALLKVFDPDERVEVQLYKYKSDGDMFLASVAANTVHGLPLQEVEKRRIALRLRDSGAKDALIGKVLNIPPARVQQILVHVVTVQEGGGSFRLEPLKRPLLHFSGKEMTERQVAAAKSAPGTSYLLTTRQLRTALTEGLIDAGDGRLATELAGLADDIAAFLANGGAAAAI